jgi:hypothetical protein
MTSPLRRDFPPPRERRSTRERAREERIALATSAPFTPWTTLYGYLRENFRQGDHVAIIGPTGTGKTHIALEVAELRAYVIVLACKPRDPLISDAISRGYWLTSGDDLSREIEYVDGRPLHPRIVAWPKLSDRAARKLPDRQLLEAERAHQRPRVAAALGYVRKTGHWAVVLDEGTWICRDLNLQRQVDSALFQFRTLNSSVIILGQRPSWMGRYVLSSPTHLFLFNTNDGDDRKALGNVSGVDTRLVAQLVERLDFSRHECLYIDTRRRTMMRTVAPAR